MQSQLTPAGLAGSARRLPVRQHAEIDGAVVWIAGVGDDARAFVWDGPGYGLRDSVDGETFRPLAAGTFGSRSSARRAVVSLAVAR